MKRANAYRMIEGWRPAALVSPIGDTNEGQARELAPVLKEYEPEVTVTLYREVKELRGERRVTAADLSEARVALPPPKHLARPPSSSSRIRRAWNVRAAERVGATAVSPATGRRRFPRHPPARGAAAPLRAGRPAAVPARATSRRGTAGSASASGRPAAICPTGRPRGRVGRSVGWVLCDEYRPRGVPAAVTRWCRVAGFRVVREPRIPEAAGGFRFRVSGRPPPPLSESTVSFRDSTTCSSMPVGG